MADITKAPVIRLNNREFDTPVLMSVPCGPGTVAEAPYWRVPTADSATGLVRFDYISGQKTKPTTDSNKVIRVRDNNTQNIYWIAVGDAGSLDNYNTKCAICCGNANDMTVPTFVAPLIETKACKDANAKYNHFTFTEALAASTHYQIVASVNGVLLTGSPNNFASLAALKTWLNANWAAGGAHVWDYTGLKVTLVSTTAQTASISVTVVAD